MLPLNQAEELARRRYDSTVTNMRLTQDYNRSIRRGRAREALERIIEGNIHNGAHPGELKHEMIPVLHRLAE